LITFTPAAAASAAAFAAVASFFIATGSYH